MNLQALKLEGLRGSCKDHRGFIYIAAIICAIVNVSETINGPGFLLGKIFGTVLNYQRDPYVWYGGSLGKCPYGDVPKGEIAFGLTLL